MAFKLAELFVALSTRGEGNVSSSLQAIKEKLIGIPVLGTAVEMAFGKVKEAIGGAFDAFTQQSSIEGRLNAMVENTGKVAGFSAEQLKGLAKELSGLSDLSDANIMGGMSQMLAFTNVRGDNFAGAIKMAMDAAASGFGSFEGNVNALGRALENPLHGMRMMGAMGIVLSEQERKQIELLMQQGKLREAQNLLLAKGAQRFGGNSEKLANPQKQLGNEMEGLSVGIGAGIAPVFNAITQGIRKLLPDGEKLRETFSEFGTTFATAVGPAIDVVVRLSTAIGNGLLGLLPEGITDAESLGDAISTAFEYCEPVVAAFSEMLTQSLGVCVDVAMGLAQGFMFVADAIGGAMGIGVGDITALFKLSSAGLQWLRENWSNVFTAIGVSMMVGLSKGWDYCKNLFQNMKAGFAGVVGAIIGLFKAMGNNMKADFTAVGDYITGMLKKDKAAIDGILAGKGLSEIIRDMKAAGSEEIGRANAQFKKSTEDRMAGIGNGWDEGVAWAGGLRNMGDESTQTKVWKAALDAVFAKFTGFHMPGENKAAAGGAAAAKYGGSREHAYDTDDQDTKATSGKVDFSAFDAFAKKIQDGLAGDTAARSTAKNTGVIAGQLAADGPIEKAVTVQGAAVVTAVKAIKFGWA